MSPWVLRLQIGVVAPWNSTTGYGPPDFDLESVGAGRDEDPPALAGQRSRRQDQVPAAMAMA
jgi:hypothetical protein